MCGTYEAAKYSRSAAEDQVHFSLLSDVSPNVLGPFVALSPNLTSDLTHLCTCLMNLNLVVDIKGLVFLVIDSHEPKAKYVADPEFFYLMARGMEIMPEKHRSTVA